MSLIVGLTGQTGSGITTACDVFANSGFAIINCDQISRDVVHSQSACLNELVLEFSNSILNEDKTLNRKVLGQIVFSDKEKLKNLNEIIHPYIMQEIEVMIKKLSLKYYVIILDAPTLFESGADKICDLIVSVIAKAEFIIPRIMARDSIDETAAKNRLASQHDAEFFVEHSDFIAQNNGLRQEFLDRLYDISQKIKEYTNGNSR